MAGVVSMPEKALKKLNSYILPEWKVCFFAALFIGLFAHFYKTVISMLVASQTTQ